MAETSDQTGLQRRATWVGLRTLRQRPKLVGETRGGEPIFEVKSVRLVLRDDAGHFSRLAECSKCGREVPGAPVMSSVDLDRAAHSVICKDCVRASVAASPLQPERRPAKAAGPAPKSEVQAEEPAEPPEDARLAAMEIQLEAAVARLAELADLGPDASAESRLQHALRQGLAEIRAEMLGVAGRAPVDDEARRRAEALAQVVHAQQSRLTTLSAVVDETGVEVRRLVESNQELARAGADLERRIDEGVTKAASDVVALERRLRGDVTTLTQLVETLRRDLEESLGAPVRTGLAMVVQALQELARARDEVKASLGDAAHEVEARMEGLASAVEEWDARLRALELKMEKSIDALTTVLESNRGDLTVAPAANSLLDGGVGGIAAARVMPGGLLDALERQLQEAEGRLARATAGPGRSGMKPADGNQGRTA